MEKEIKKTSNTSLEGLPHGQGTETFPDGRKHEGEFKGGLSHGQGTFTSPDGYKYEGEFKEGGYHGQGTWIHPDGGSNCSGLPLF